MLDWRPCESHRTPLPASESPSSLGLGGIGPGGESPPKEKKKKKGEENLSLYKQLQYPERSVYFGGE